MISVIVGLALSANADSAQELVERAMNLLGGREKLESIRQLTVTTSGHYYSVEQSERPSGPYITTYARGTRSFDFDKLSETSEQTFAGLVYGGREIPRKYVIEAGVGKTSTPYENVASFRRLALGPERVLLYAMRARDLHLGADTIFNDVPHSVVEFKWGHVLVRLFLKKDTGAPSGVETTSPLPFPWTTWGDVAMTTRWGTWQVLEGGIMEPTQFSTSAGGYPVEDETVLGSKLVLGPGKPSLPLPTLPPKEDQQAFLDRYSPKVVVAGVTEYAGPFNTFVVEQPDGLVVVEPVMTSAFASAFLDKIANDFPGKRVMAVVATDDAWPHFGGFRTFVARGVELVGLDLNQALVERQFKAVHSSLPDELAQHPAKLRYRSVRKPMMIGAGPNRFVLYPIAGQGSERMLMAYFPEHHLLYGSDLLQKQGDGFFFPAYPKELVEAVCREKLDVQTVFAEHLLPTPWKTITDFVERVTK
jgi:hypothetical protein